MDSLKLPVLTVSPDPNAFSAFAEAIYKQRYSHETLEFWEQIAYRVASNVCAAAPEYYSPTEVCEYIKTRKFMPGGRYLYAAGRPFHQVQNCLLNRAEDSREGWADLMHKVTMSLMTGAGVGVDYSAVRAEGAVVSRTGGFSTGPLALAQMVNEAGRHIMQGGARRCLPSGTLVSMEGGYKKCIEEVQPGEFVQTRLGAYKILDKAYQGKQEVILFRTTHGTVSSTKNHRWLAARSDRSKQWYMAEELEVGHKLYYHPTPRQEGIEYNAQEAYTLGFFMGNGCAYSSGRTHEVTFQIANNWLVEQQVSLIKNVMSSYGSNPIVRLGHGACIEIRCRSKDLVTKFQKFKKPHKAPVIPEFIWNADLSARSAFLSGWLDSDGYFGEDSWKLSNKHPEVLLQLQRFCESLGLVTTINGLELRFSSYQRRLMDQLLYDTSFKFPESYNSKDTSEIPSKILEITHLTPVDTWDLQIEEVEEFIADDFVSHNSALWAGLSWDHPDILKFVHLKNWSSEVRRAKELDYNFPATLDGTNISVILDKNFFDAYAANEPHARAVYWQTVRQMLSTGEPGFSVNYANQQESLRNAPIAGNTRVLTPTGEAVVSDIIGRDIVVWTGVRWANTKFTCTRQQSPLVTISLSNTRRLTCSPEHPFILASGERQAASKLQLDTQLKSVNPYNQVTVTGIKHQPYTEDVYCCDVKFEEHSFAAEGVIVSNCTEVVSEDDSDVCNLGSVNLARVSTIAEFRKVVVAATTFLLAGTLYSDLPYTKVGEVRARNRRLGLGLLGIHEWLLQRGYKYGPCDELTEWLECYKTVSSATASSCASAWGLSQPVAVRAIAPTGTIGIVAETTTGIEPVFCVAYRRRYKGPDGKTTQYQYVVDPTAKRLIDQGVEPALVEDAYTLAGDPERRVAFQAYVQQYVDQSISSTINLPEWGSELNNEAGVERFGNMLLQYLPSLRGITVYPDAARDGQPLSRVKYETAVSHEGQVFVEQADLCDLTGSGTCGA